MGIDECRNSRYDRGVPVHAHWTVASFSNWRPQVPPPFFLGSKIYTRRDILRQTTVGSASVISNPFDLSKWHRVDRHDGYVVGNGHMYMVAGLGWDLDLTTKSRVTSVKAPLSRIAWVIGPSYALGNLGWGWDVEAASDNGAIAWEAETIVSPSLDCPFWGVECTSPTLTVNISDIIMADHPVIVRRVTLRCPLTSQGANVRLRIPVRFDPRNGGEMFSLKHDHEHANTPPLARESAATGVSSRRRICYSCSPTGVVPGRFDSYSRRK